MTRTAWIVLAVTIGVPAIVVAILWYLALTLVS